MALNINQVNKMDKIVIKDSQKLLFLKYYDSIDFDEVNKLNLGLSIPKCVLEIELGFDEKVLKNMPEYHSLVAKIKEKKSITLDVAKQQAIDYFKKQFTTYRELFYIEVCESGIIDIKRFDIINNGNDIDVLYDGKYEKEMMYNFYHDFVKSEERKSMAKETLSLALSLFFSFNVYSVLNESVVQKKRVEQKITKKQRSNNKKSKSKTKVSRIYYVSDEETLLKVSKRNYNKPNHSFGVRGHFRTLKNGKKVWIKPYKKGDKEDFEQKTYTM